MTTYNELTIVNAANSTIEVILMPKIYKATWLVHARMGIMCVTNSMRFASQVH